MPRSQSHDRNHDQHPSRASSRRDNQNRSAHRANSASQCRGHNGIRDGSESATCNDRGGDDTFDGDSSAASAAKPSGGIQPEATTGLPNQEVGAIDLNWPWRERIDDIIVFHSLDRKHLRRIVDIQLGQLRKLLAGRDMNLVLDEGAIDDPLAGRGEVVAGAFGIAGLDRSWNGID
ncbi:MAG: hypothetical protein HC781_01555, partial [Leptolyngbyaceae cyanobacterium CSU_1_4]|nr:hypothetical protein [Leptolyngbyaceae cyanobacterium CSU_1_4]